jgi:hypothetical protein
MATKRRVVASLVLGCILVLASCSDEATVTAPVPPPDRGLLDGTLGLLGGSSFQVLQRSHPLAQDESVTQVIGSAGGVIRLPDAGLTVYFPEDAVSTPTSITVDAPAGNLVGYHFAPHGLQFAHPLTAVQDMSKTDAGLLGQLLSGPLEAAYFVGDLDPTVNALQILHFNLLGLLGTGEFDIQHFSGYVIGTN